MMHTLQSLLDEFKKFALKGSVVDLAVGLVIGAGVSKIVNSLVNDIIMPPVGMILGGVDFNDLTITLKDAVGSSPAVQVRYGAFITSIVDFFIVAVCVFTVVKFMNRLRFPLFASAKTKECSECASTIPQKAKRCPFCTSPQKPF